MARSLESLEETITTLGFQIPLQLNALELAMEIINTLKDAKSKMYTPTLENNETYSYTIWPQEEIVQTQQGVYVKVGKDEGGVAERLGLFAFSLSFLLSSTVEALPIYLQERLDILFAVPVYWIVGFNPSIAAFAFFAFVVWLIVLMASSLVLFPSAVLSPDFTSGNSLICTVLGAFFLFSGYFTPNIGGS
ncbi:hypothetical protein D5086_002479, partial [Populus alba]